MAKCCVGYNAYDTVPSMSMIPCSRPTIELQLNDISAIASVGSKFDPYDVTWCLFDVSKAHSKSGVAAAESSSFHTINNALIKSGLFRRSQSLLVSHVSFL